jgi:TRAP-type transport system periplasmic protein
MKNIISKSMMIVLVGVITVTIFLLSACTSPTEPAASIVATKPISTSENPISLRMGTIMAASHPLEVFNLKWMEKIQKETNGKVQFFYYPGGTLIDMFGAYDEILACVADIGMCSPSSQGAPFPLGSGIMNFFYGIDFKGARQVYNELWKEFPELSAEYGEVKRLFAIGGPELYIHTRNKPILTINDFKGLQLQPSMQFPDLANKLGSTGSMLPPGEIYSALDKGIIDGTFLSADTLETSNMADLTKYSTNVHISSPPGTFYAMNLNTWNSLPPEIQKVFDDSSSWMESELDGIQLDMEQKAIDYAKARGHEFSELSVEDMVKFNSIVEEIATAKVVELDAKGLPGTKIFRETRRLIDEYNKK